MVVFVKTIIGKTIAIKTNTCAVVFKLVEGIHDKEGVPMANMRLIYGGKPLDHGRFLSDYNIQHEATVHMVFRLLGGR